MKDPKEETTYGLSPDRLAKLLGLVEKPSLSVPQTSEEEIQKSEDDYSVMLCPVCEKGRMVEVETIRPNRAEAVKLLSFLVHDTR